MIVAIFEMPVCRFLSQQVDALIRKFAVVDRVHRVSGLVLQQLSTFHAYLVFLVCYLECVNMMSYVTKCRNYARFDIQAN